MASQSLRSSSSVLGGMNSKEKDSAAGRQQVADGRRVRDTVPRHAPRLAGPGGPHGPAGLSMADHRHQGRSSHVDLGAGRRAGACPPGHVRRGTSAGARPPAGHGYPRDHDRTGGGCARPRSRPGRPGAHRISSAGSGRWRPRIAAEMLPAIDATADVLAGGKRLRPGVLLLGLARGRRGRRPGHPRRRGRARAAARRRARARRRAGRQRYPPRQPDDPPAVRRAACRRGLAGSRCAVRPRCRRSCSATCCWPGPTSCSAAAACRRRR